MRRNVILFGTLILCWCMIAFAILPAESAPAKITLTK